IAGADIGVGRGIPGEGHLLGMGHAFAVYIEDMQFTIVLVLAVDNRETGDLDRLHTVRASAEIQRSGGRLEVGTGQVASATINAMGLGFIVERSGCRRARLRRSVLEPDVAAEIYRGAVAPL